MEKTNLPERATITANQIEILKELKAGHSQHRVARDLQKSVTAVNDAIQAIKCNWPALQRLIREIEDNDLEKIITGEATVQESPQLRWLKRRWEEGYHLGGVPYGYRKDSNGDLFQILEEAKVVNKMFRGTDRGKSQRQLATETGVAPDRIWYILRNPVYKGYVCLYGKCHRGRHYSRAIVPEGVFDRVQQKLSGRRHLGMRMLPHGYLYKNREVKQEPEEAREMDKMFKLGEEGKSFAEIGRELGWDTGTVRTRLMNPFYCGKKWKNGELVDEDVDYEPIVSVERWRTANSFDRKWGDRERLKKHWEDIGETNRNKVLSSLDNTIWKTRRQIADETDLSKETVRKHILSLVNDGYVEMIPPKPKKGALPVPGKYRRKF